MSESKKIIHATYELSLIKCDNEIFTEESCGGLMDRDILGRIGIKPFTCLDESETIEIPLNKTYILNLIRGLTELL